MIIARVYNGFLSLAFASVGAIVGQKNSNLVWGLLLLRLGLGIFLAMWSVDKLAEPDIAQHVFSQLYLVNINSSIVMIIGAVELVLSLLIVFGMYKTVTYGLGLLVHTASTIAAYEHLLEPFGKNHLIIATIPVLFAFLTLFLLRDLDTKFALGKKKSLFT